MARLVLTDTSPLLGLARVSGLNWLQELFGKVLLTPEVMTEALPGKGSRSGAIGKLCPGLLVAAQRVQGDADICVVECDTIFGCPGGRASSQRLRAC